MASLGEVRPGKVRCGVARRGEDIGENKTGGQGLAWSGKLWLALAR